eukprot:6006657-Prymnesium_polylepis.1
MEDPKADEVPEPDPAAFIEFKSHEQAISALRQVGFAGADTTPSFTPEDLTEAVVLKEWCAAAAGARDFRMRAQA